MKTKESTENTPHKGGFYYVCEKNSKHWQAIADIATKEYGDKIYIYCNKILSFFKAHEEMFNESNFQKLIFSDDFVWSDGIELNR